MCYTLCVKTYREILEGARRERKAIGHFNFANFEMFWGVVNAAGKLGVPVILGLAEHEQDWVGLNQAVALVKSLREDEYNVFLNADHNYSFERVKSAIDAGFDSVIFDGAKLPIDENIKITKQCVLYARDVGRVTGRDILIEGELGYIGEGSMVRDVLPNGIETTSVSDAKRFVEETGVDLFAPAVGNIHGMLRGASDPALNTELICEIAKHVRVPLVLHGGSGTPNIRETIKAGISEVHISTELRKAWRDAILTHLEKYPNEVAPYKVAHGALEAVEKVATHYLQMFSGE